MKVGGERGIRTPDTFNYLKCAYLFEKWPIWTGLTALVVMRYRYATIHTTYGKPPQTTRQASLVCRLLYS